MAVPINTNTQQIVSTLVRDGRVRRAYLGVAAGPRPLPPRIAQRLGRERGIEVTAVMPNTPAARAGLRAEDAIVTVDDVPVEDVGDLQRLMVVERIGHSIPVELVRGGDLMTIELVPAELRE
jgi:S1-C subfamily serine protease